MIDDTRPLLKNSNKCANRLFTSYEFHSPLIDLSTYRKCSISKPEGLSQFNMTPNSVIVLFTLTQLRAIPVRTFPLIDCNCTSTYKLVCSY